MSRYEAVIGLEVHAQLRTKSKIFALFTSFEPIPTRTSAPLRRHARRAPRAQREGRGICRQDGHGHRLPHQPDLGLRPQELLLSRPPQRIPDIPVRNPFVRARPSGHHGQRRGKDRGRHPHPHRGGCREKHPLHHRERQLRGPQPDRGAAYRDRQRTRHAQCRGGRGLPEGIALHPGLSRHLRRQHGGGLVSLRRQRESSALRTGRVRNPRRTQEHELLPPCPKGHRIRDRAPDRPFGRRSGRGPGNAAVQRRQGRHRLHARQGGGPRLPLFPGPRPVPLVVTQAKLDLWRSEFRNFPRPAAIVSCPGMGCLPRTPTCSPPNATWPTISRRLPGSAANPRKPPTGSCPNCCAN